MALELKPVQPADAIKALQLRGGQLSPSFAWQDVYGTEHANMFTVARSAGFDILQDIHDGLSKALQEGKTFHDFAAELKPLLQAKGWWGKQLVDDPKTGDQTGVQLGSTRRLQTIFNANMRVSYATGHWANFERNKVARPYLRYVAILDQRTRPEHAARHNLCLPLDDPYWNSWAPPCGWNCRCTLQSLSAREVDQMRDVLKFEPPADVMRAWVNKRTGEVLRIPEGIDPGWEHNPGRVGAEAAINDALAQKAAGAPYELVAPLVEERVRSDAFARFLINPQGMMPVMPIPPSIGNAMGTDARVALLSEDTMLKQLRNHPELTRDDYMQLPSIGVTPTMVFQDGNQTFVLVKLVTDRWLYAAMKATRSGKAYFITSYRYARETNIQRMLTRKGVRLLLDRRET